MMYACVCSSSGCSSVTFFLFLSLSPVVRTVVPLYRWIVLIVQWILN